LAFLLCLDRTSMALSRRSNLWLADTLWKLGSVQFGDFTLGRHGVKGCYQGVGLIVRVGARRRGGARPAPVVMVSPRRLLDWRSLLPPVEDEEPAPGEPPARGYGNIPMRGLPCRLCPSYSGGIHGCTRPGTG